MFMLRCDMETLAFSKMAPSMMLSGLGPILPAGVKWNHCFKIVMTSKAARDRESPSPLARIIEVEWPGPRYCRKMIVDRVSKFD